MSWISRTEGGRDTGQEQVEKDKLYSLQRLEQRTQAWLESGFNGMNDRVFSGRHRTRKKLGMCTYTWVCVHVHMCGGRTSQHTDG